MRFFVADNFSFGAGQDSEAFGAQPFGIGAGIGVNFGTGAGQDIFGTSSGNSQQRWEAQADGKTTQQSGPGFTGINVLPSSQINYGGYDQRDSTAIVRPPQQKMRDLTATQRFRILTGLIDAHATSSDRNVSTPNTVGEVAGNRDASFGSATRPPLLGGRSPTNSNQVGNFGTRVQDNIVSKFGTATIGAPGESSALHLSSIINNPSRIGAPEGRPWASPIG